MTRSLYQAEKSSLCGVTPRPSALTSTRLLQPAADQNQIHRLPNGPWLRLPRPAVRPPLRFAVAAALGHDRYGTDPGGHGGVDRQVADRFRLVPARRRQSGEAAEVLRQPVPAGRGGLRLLRAARRADRRGLGGTDPGRVHLQRQGLQPVHPAPHPGADAARRPAGGRRQDGQGPGLPQGRRPGGDRRRPGTGSSRRSSRCARRASSARSCSSSRPGSRSRGRTRSTSSPARSGPPRGGSASSSATTPG